MPESLLQLCSQGAVIQKHTWAQHRDTDGQWWHQNSHPGHTSGHACSRGTRQVLRSQHSLGLPESSRFPHPTHTLGVFIEARSSTAGAIRPRLQTQSGSQIHLLLLFRTGISARVEFSPLQNACLKLYSTCKINCISISMLWHAISLFPITLPAFLVKSNSLSASHQEVEIAFPSPRR